MQPHVIEDLGGVIRTGLETVGADHLPVSGRSVCSRQVINGPCFFFFFLFRPRKYRTHPKVPESARMGTDRRHGMIIKTR